MATGAPSPADGRQAAAEARRELLARYHETFAQWRALDYRLATGGPAEDRALLEEHTKLLGQVFALHGKYRDLVPVVPVSRDPLSGRVLYLSVDTMGLDGLWWDYDHPVRPPDRVMDTLVSVTGALGPGGPFEAAPFTVMPGPGVPFVVPGLLEIPGCVAVVSSVRVGAHMGYPVCYFAGSVPPGTKRPPAWGSRGWTLWSFCGGYSWGDEEDVMTGRDFELGGYLDRGVLSWIAPGDATFTIRKGRQGCPYLGLSGDREDIWIRDGKRFDPSSGEV